MKVTLLAKVLLALMSVVSLTKAQATETSADAHENEENSSNRFQKDQQPRVLIDQSHDYLFIVLHLGTFLKINGLMGALSQATLSPAVFGNCDIIVTHQSRSNVLYTDEQIESLVEFVSSGGGLLIIGYGPGYVDFAKSKSLSLDAWSVNSLARKFQCSFSVEAGALPFRLESHALTREVREVSYIDKNPRIGIARVSDDFNVLLSDSSGHPVLAVRPFGKGRVAILTEYRFIKTIDEPSNSRLFVDLFKWLGANSQNKKKLANSSVADIFPGIQLSKGHDYELVGKPEPDNFDGGPDFIWPEIERRLENITFQYSGSMSERAQFIVENYPSVYNTLFQLFQVKPDQEMIFQALPTAGGGYHWTKQKLVAIGVLADDNAVLGIMGHEMVHAWGLPTPKNFPHGWTAYTDDYVARKLNLRSEEQITANWHRELEKVKKVDPKLDSLDIIEVTEDLERQRIIDKKIGWMLKELGKRYGVEFFAKLMKIFREQSPSHSERDTYEDLPLDDFIYFASLAAGENLYFWFESLGTTVHPRAMDLPLCPIYQPDK